MQLAYYAQAHEQLTPRRTVLQESSHAAPGGRGGADLPGRFLFSNDDAFKTVRSLSGGRQRLAKMALGNANLLVLDEPTNHLDIYSRAALEDVLTGFAGTVIFVSHDRYLIDALATHVWEIANGTLTTHRGGWAGYLADREARPPCRPRRRPGGERRTGGTPGGPRTRARSGWPARSEIAAPGAVAGAGRGAQHASDAGDGKADRRPGAPARRGQQALTRHEESGWPWWKRS